MSTSLPQQPRIRVAVLGGGISGLTTAFELSRTDTARNLYDVTVYSQGWRLGGKLASSSGIYNRNEEHGLHVWFGCYENAFGVFRDVFEKWRKPDNCPFQKWSDAFTGVSLTPFGEWKDGTREEWNIFWPTNDGVPGEGHVNWDLSEVITGLLSFLKNLWKNLWEANDGHEEWSVDRIFDFFKTKRDSEKIDSQHIRNCIDLTIAIIEGLRNPAYNLGPNLNLDNINHLEFRQFLIENGANAKIVREWSMVRALYDAWFEYRDGDTSQPDFEAGTALRTLLRIALTYKGHVAYLVNAGMGETVIAPLYEVCQSNGVKFEFFNKVTDFKTLGNFVEEVQIGVQAETFGKYKATEIVGGLVHWPQEPFWNQIVNGEELRARGINFESKFSPPYNMKAKTLVCGVDFDVVVLAFPVTCLRSFSQEPAPGQALFSASPLWNSMVHAMGIVPSCSLQLWCTKSLAQLGWSQGKPAMDSWVYPQDVWADMSQVLEREVWPSDHKPKSLHYFCGTWGTRSYASKSNQPEILIQETAKCKEQSIAQFQNYGTSLWPGAKETDGSFDWNTLVDPTGKQGPERFDFQYLKVNIDPWECCVGSPVGSFKNRMRSNETDFANLIIAGEAAHTGMDSSCVESCVMSGRQAARALLNNNLEVPGEHWMGS
jgi:uncharacterized protein with NAD-binding domain and iron-sulfur cluster